MAEANGTRACVVCGCEFPRDGKRVLCSDACKHERQLQYHRTPPRETQCICCGGVFLGAANKRYCGRRCKDAARSARPQKQRNRKRDISESDRARIADARRISRRKNGRGDRSAEYQRRKQRLGTAARKAERKLLAEHAMALRINAAMDRSVARVAAKANRDRAKAEAIAARIERGESEHTAKLKANPDRYAAELTRCRAKSFKRKTGKDMLADGTASAVVILGGKRCLYCNCALTDENRSHDHMIPLVKGGVHSAANIAPSCKSCNFRKGPKGFSEWVNMLAEPHRLRAIRFFEKRNGHVGQACLPLAA